MLRLLQRLNLHYSWMCIYNMFLKTKSQDFTIYSGNFNPISAILSKILQNPCICWLCSSIFFFFFTYISTPHFAWIKPFFTLKWKKHQTQPVLYLFPASYSMFGQMCIPDFPVYLEKRQQVELARSGWMVGDRQQEVTSRFIWLLFVFRLITTLRFPRAGTASPGSTPLPRFSLISAV